MDINRQDIAFVAGNGWCTFSNDQKPNQEIILSHIVNPIKCVLDGCGSAPHSEVGAALFAQFFSYFSEEITIPDDFERAANITMLALANEIFSNDRLRFDNLRFTILACMETRNQFITKTCGDGFIVAVRCNGEIVITKLKGSTQIGDDEYPDYLIHNYIEDRKSLLEPLRYREVGFTTATFDKTEFVRVGVATDGLRFLDELSVSELQRWNEALLADKEPQVSEIIKRNHAKFRDDVSICI